MVTLEKAVIARITSHGHHFEVLVDSEKALALRGGSSIDIREVLALPKIFSDSHKGLEASHKALIEVFKTDDALEVAKSIILRGEVQLTQEYRQKLRDVKRRQIIHLIHTNGVDPKTHAPHPMERIESAMNELKVHVDEFKASEEQMQEILGKLKVLLPIKFEVKELEIKISPNYAGKSYPLLKKFGTIIEEHWQNNGYLHATLEIPGGLETDFYSQINALCHGEVEVIVKKIK